MKFLGNQGQQRILGIFAHPDDELFCAGGLLAQAAARGAETMIVSATRGEAGQIRDAQEVEKVLFLYEKFGVSFWGLNYVFERK